MMDRKQFANIGVTLETKTREFETAGDIGFTASIRNDGEEPVPVDLYILGNPSLVLEVLDGRNETVHLVPASVPLPEDDRPQPEDLPPGQSKVLNFANFLDPSLDPGEYRVRFCYCPDPGQPEEQVTSEWLTVSVSSAVSFGEPVILQEVWYRFFIDWLYRIWCWIRKILGLRKRCDKTASVEVDEARSETISNAPPGSEAWNGTYNWQARFRLALDQARCRFTVTVRIAINGALTNAQRTAWENAIENKFNNAFKLCCTERCCGDCCPDGYALVFDVQFGAANPHHTVNVQATTSNMTNWGANDTVSITHEFVHMLGASDEYYTVDGTNYGMPWQNGAGIMNNPNENMLPRHLALVVQKAQQLLGNNANCTVKGANENCR